MDPAGLAEARGWIEDWSADLDRKVEQSSAFAEAMAGVSATVSTAGGAVRVAVDASGAVTDLFLDDRVRRWPGTRIAAEILAAMRQAQAQLAAQVAAVAAQTVGADSPLGREVTDSYTRRYPIPVEDETPRQNRS